MPSLCMFWRIYAMLYSIMFFCALCIVEAVKSADEVASYAADALEFNTYAIESSALFFHFECHPYMKCVF